LKVLRAPVIYVAATKPFVPRVQYLKCSVTSELGTKLKEFIKLAFIEWKNGY
jgi:hypothetical protein